MNLNEYAESNLKEEIKLGFEIIDKFKESYNKEYNKKIAELKENYENLCKANPDKTYQLPEPHDDIDNRIFLNTKKIMDELCFVGLYKLIEIERKNILKFYCKKINNKDLNNYKCLECILPFSMVSIEKYNAVNEIRLINNAIKHEGKITEILIKKYPHWKKLHGIVNNNEILNLIFDELDEAYIRLRPDAEEYLYSFLEKVKKNKMTK